MPLKLFLQNNILKGLNTFLNERFQFLNLNKYAKI